MLTTEQIEEKGFSLFNDSKKSCSNSIDNRTDYISCGTFKKRKQLILLSYYDNGLMKITDYFADPLISREYHFIGEVFTEEEYCKVIDKLKYDLCALNPCSENNCENCG